MMVADAYLRAARPALQSEGIRSIKQKLRPTAAVDTFRYKQHIPLKVTSLPSSDHKQRRVGAGDVNTDMQESSE